MPIGQKYSVNEEEKREGESQEGQELDEKDRERENEEAKTRRNGFNRSPLIHHLICMRFPFEAMASRRRRVKAPAQSVLSPRR